jgi:hypothetical protein
MAISHAGYHNRSRHVTCLSAPSCALGARAGQNLEASDAQNRAGNIIRAVRNPPHEESQKVKICLDTNPGNGILYQKFDGI